MALDPRDALATISNAVPQLKLTWDEHLILQDCIKTLLGVVEREEKQIAEGLARWKKVELPGGKEEEKKPE